MKLKKYIVLIMIILLSTGCFKRDLMDDISITTTSYPIKYLISSIYGYNANITSIYPLGVNPNSYELTEKQIKEYANTDMVVYNGLTKDKKLAATFLNKNDDLKIIDSAKGISIQYGEEELWLCPSNYLMLAQNIKNELSYYTNSTVLKQEIEDNYNKLNVIISKYDADLKLTASQANKKTLIVGNNSLKFLKKYGFTVYSIEEDENGISDYQDAKNLIESKTNKYVYILNTDEESENLANFKALGAEVKTIHSMSYLTEEENNNNTDYETLMNNLIENIKAEAYN